MSDASPDASTPWDPSRPDRRSRPTPMLSRYLLRGRRVGAAGEEFAYVDRPGPWAIGALVALLVLSVADAWFTLRVIDHGGTEANPIMHAALDLGDLPFVVLKTIVTFVGAAFLCLHKNWPLGRLCLWLALAGYAALTVYHLSIQSQLPLQ